METIVYINFLIFVIVSFTCVVIGLDLKNWSSWIFGLYGFISGSLFGLLQGDRSLDLPLGSLFAIAVMSGGAVTRWHRQRYMDVAESWISKHGQDTRISWVVHFIKRLLKK